MTIIESLELGALFALSILARLQAPNKSTSSIACCANNQTIAKKQKINYHRPLCSKCNQHLVLSILLSTPPPPRLPFGLSFSPVHCHFFTISACSPSLSFPLSLSPAVPNSLLNPPSRSLSLTLSPHCVIGECGFYDYIIATCLSPLVIPHISAVLRSGIGLTKAWRTMEGRVCQRCDLHTTARARLSQAYAEQPRGLHWIARMNGSLPLLL